jgi:glycopeptide antibiotics resistance protein
MKTFFATFLNLFFCFLLISLGATALENNAKGSSKIVDPCNGTGGTGQIVGLGKGTITIKLGNGSRQLVNFTSQTTIKTSSGFASKSILKSGDRVTLVGDNNPDGSFTANTIVLCSDSGKATGTVENNVIDFNKIKSTSSAIALSTILIFVLIWLGITAVMRLKKKKSRIFLLFFTIFYVYLYKVLNYTLIQFQSLIVLKYFIPDLILNGQSAGQNLNLIPLLGLTPNDLRTSLLNIVLFIPFGFGLPFITNFCMKKTVVIGAIFSFFIELLQLLTGFMAEVTFRVSDINDVIFNSFGAAIGYMFFFAFMRLYLHYFFRWHLPGNSFLRYIANRPQVGNHNLHGG